MQKTHILLMIGIIAFLAVGCNQSVPDIEGLSYEDIINNQHDNPPAAMEIEKILWEKIINEKEVVVLFLNRERTISAARIANINEEYKASISVPVGKSGDEAISWQWSLLSRLTTEANPEVAAIVWGYIYSPDVRKVLVGSHNNTTSLEEAEILQFDEYDIKLYYFLTDDKTGFEYDTVVACDAFGNILYSNELRWSLRPITPS